MASCLEFASTFQRLGWTSVIRPTTRSPTSGLYLLPVDETTRVTRGVNIPGMDWPNSDEFVYSVNGSDHGRNDLLVLDICAMASGDVQQRK
jgi:hypothetical protein